MREKLGLHCDVISGYAFSTSDWKDEGVPVVKIGNISNGEDIICDEQIQYVNESFLDKLDEKYHITKGDVLISLTGSHINQPNSMVGRTCRSLTDRKYLLNQRAGKVLPFDNTNKNYLYYLLSTQAIKYDIANRAYGGANQVNVSPKDIKKIKWEFPDFSTQKRIADILSAYDDLIENNNRRIALLEKAAQELYKEWFVRFRFPGYETTKFENGLPNGWSLKKIGEISKIGAGGDAPKDYSSVRTREYSIPIFSNGMTNDGLYGYTKKGTKKANSITISARGTVGYTCLRFEPYLPIVRLLSIEPDAQLINVYYLYHNLKNDSIDGYGTSQQQITIPFFTKKKVVVPSITLQNEFGNIVEFFYNQINKLKAKNINLIKQRDLLLPRLMSGKLEV